jgi:rod shape-determining protein MreD
MRQMNAFYYVYAVLILLLGLAQSTVIPHIRIAGVHPDIMLILVVSWSMLRGIREGVIWALAGGIILDLLSAAPFGMFTLSLICAAFLPRIGTVNFFRSHAPVVLISVALATICSYAVSLLVLYVAGRTPAMFELAGRLIVPNLAINVAAALLVFPPTRWLHHQTAPREMQW